MFKSLVFLTGIYQLTGRKQRTVGCPYCKPLPRWASNSTVGNSTDL